MAATSLATATAIATVPAGVMLAPEQAEASTIKTWTSKFGGDGTISLGLSNPFNTTGYALFASYDLDGNEIYIDGSMTSPLNAGANPNWIIVRDELDENGNNKNNGLSGRIGLESIINGVDVTDEERAKWWSIT